MKITLGKLLEDKGREVWSVTPAVSVYEALERMADKNIGAVLVLEGDRIVGIFSERDYAREVVLKGLSSRDVPVSEIMSRSVSCVPVHRTLDECMALMTARRIRHLPVLDQGKLVGLVSIGDVVKAVIAEQQFTINELEAFANRALKERT